MPRLSGVVAKTVERSSPGSRRTTPMNDELEHQLRRDLIRARYGENTSGVRVDLRKIIKLEEAARTYAARREREAVRAFIEQGWGRRCKTRDTEDFPELKDHLDGRCATCEMWEVYDEYFELKAGGKQG